MTDEQTLALAEARTYFRNDAVADALALVEVLLGEYPAWSDALLLHGQILFETGHKIDAAHTLRRAVEADPDNAEAFYALGLTFRHLRKLDDAEGCLKAALRRNPEDDDARFVLANVLFDRRDLAGAIAAYTTLLVKRPDDADLHFNLARAADDAGNTDVACLSYAAYLALSADGPDNDSFRLLATDRLGLIRAGGWQPLDWSDPSDT